LNDLDLQAEAVIFLGLPTYDFSIHHAGTHISKPKVLATA
jgi:hypothetical protein